MTLEKLKELLQGQPPYRVKQAAHAVFQEAVANFDEITTLPAALRARLKDAALLSFDVDAVQSSADGRAHKAALKLSDGRRMESVLMSPKPGLWTTCISSQVGCALACSFCATGLMGFIRNLSAEEITDQVLFWRQHIRRQGGPGRLLNIVYMGMGEPFLNIDNVFASLRSLLDPEQFGFGDRHVSVSTAGIAPGIERFAEAFPQVNLALSLHAASPELRGRLVPLNKAYPLERLQAALTGYFQKNRRKVFIEYVLLDGENDRPEDAKALVKFLRGAGPAQLLHVNLIVFNPTDTPHHASRPEAAKAFKAAVEAAGFPSTFRKNLGQDIAGACGQLVLKSEKAAVGETQGGPP